MASNKHFRFGPIALTTTPGTDILNPGTTTGGVNDGASALFITLKHIQITNKTSSAASFSLWIGASGANVAGTEFMGTNRQVAANEVVDWYSPGLRLDAADFLVGGSNTGSALTISGEGEIGVA